MQHSLMQSWTSPGVRQIDPRRKSALFSHLSNFFTQCVYRNGYSDASIISDDVHSVEIGTSPLI